MSGAEIVVRMTTHDRPLLLLQAFNHALRECEAYGGGASLFLFDDHSTNEMTLNLLRDARDSGVTMEPHRGQPSRNPHLAVGMAQLACMRETLRLFPDAQWIVKVDDDVALREGAIAALFKAWVFSPSPLWVSGLQMDHDREAVGLALAEDPDAITATADMAGSHALILYDRPFVEEWIRFVDTKSKPDHVYRCGFDRHMARFAKAYYPSRQHVVTIPSQAYHCANGGVHVRGNVNLEEQWEGIRVDGD